MVALEKKLKRLHHLSHIGSILGWDEAVMMPSGGCNERAEALAELAGLQHEFFCDPAMGHEINEGLLKSKSPQERINLSELKREWVTATALPKDLVEKLTLTRVKTENLWRNLRPKNDWKEFLPHLEQLFAQTLESSQILGEKLGVAPLQAAIGRYNPGLEIKEIDRIFNSLREFLPSLIQQATEKKKSKKYRKLEGEFPIHKQKELGLRVMGLLGFNFDHGRLDESHHPFCGGVPQDVRITTRYSKDEFTQSLMGIIHETGHGLYEQHLPQELKYWPSGAARGMAIHESQSLFFEMQVGMSPEFLGLISPFIKEFLGGESNVSELTAEDIYENVAQVGPSYIRVEADEVTYPCHVILRYEIERMLFSGEAKVKDIPAIWNEKMKQYLGLSTEGNFKDGCMQDVHWPAGIFGYFPSYTLGAVLAAQLFSAMESSIGNVRQKISKGQFEEIRSWLDRNIWKVASQKSIDEVIKDATGSSLQVTAFQNHLTNRYLK